VAKKIRILMLLVILVGLAAHVGVTAQAQGKELSGVVRVGSWDSAEALEPFNKAIESFKALHPNVEVKLESVPQEYGTKLLAQFAAGNAPDIFQVGDGDMAKFQALGAVEALDPFIKGSDGLDMNTFFPAVAAFGVVNKQTYYLTKDYSPLVLYYNADQFKEAGVNPPTADWKWQDMLDAALTLTVDSNGNNAKSDKFDATKIARWGIQLPDSWGDALWLRGILPIIYQNGGKMISDDGKTTEGFMNSKETVEAVQWYVDLFKKHHVAPTKEDVDARPGVDLFQSGLVSMLWTGRWPLKDFAKNPKLNFGTSGLPSGAKGKANVLCWAGFALYSKSQNKDAAWAFLKHIAAGEGAKAFADYAFTAVKPIAESQGLSTEKHNAPIVQDLENVKQLPEASHPRWVDCGEKAFKEQLEQVLLKDLAVQEAMDAAVKAADTCLAQPS
jgi:multiple sugar transport system substrate-binding protein